MSFTDLDLAPVYNSIADDVYYEFFNKVLSSSKLCMRIGGIFSSRNFASCAEGIQQFIINDGVMKLILTASFSSADIRAIKNGTNYPGEIISEQWIKDLKEIKAKFQSDHVKALAWMLANKFLEIKLMIPYHSDGTIVEADELRGMNDFKIKTGIYWDRKNNAVSFSGNIDFDSKMLGEYYHFNVFRNWDQSEKKWVDKHAKDFDQYWNNEEVEVGVSTNYKVRVITLPDAIRDNLITIAPDSKKEINLTKPPTLRPYQQTAVNNWCGNGSKGILEMATGTGKTFTAIQCIKQVLEEQKSLIVVIVCPYINLMHQWVKELDKWDLRGTVISGDRFWRESIRDIITLSESGGRTEPYIILTSYNTYSDDKFLALIKQAKTALMLVADEVHHAAAGKFRKGLLESYQYRLGLTATLERYFDPSGTDILEKYFSGTVYELGLDKAIKFGFLVGYYYYPSYVDLTDTEYQQYRKQTKKIAMYYNSHELKDRERLQRALLNRAKIVRDAEQKLDSFESFILEHPSINHTIIFCSENQKIQVKQMLHKLRPRPILCREITAKNPSDPEQRVKIIKGLAQEDYQAIVAIGVLDEGADIPEAQNCVLLSSTGNPKQFVQRRGRVLRPFNGTYRDGKKKTFANIYDLLVIPPLSHDYTEEEENVEKSIIISQLKRQELMGQLAINKLECIQEIEKIRNKFGL